MLEAVLEYRRRMTKEERDAIVAAATIRDDIQDFIDDGGNEIESSEKICRHSEIGYECPQCIKAAKRGKVFMKIGLYLAGASVALYAALYVLGRFIGQ